MTLKPEHSGTYTYTFTHLSDAHYSKVPLKGKNGKEGGDEFKTTARVHPLASAQFVGYSSSSGRNGAGKKGVSVTNCAGNSEEFEVDLRVCCCPLTAFIFRVWVWIWILTVRVCVLHLGNSPLQPRRSTRQPYWFTDQDFQEPQERETNDTSAHFGGLG